jgi:hypothetical protein
VRVEPGAFERLPRHLQHLPLLRVHRECLAWGDAEERGVETGCRAQEPALTDIRRAGVVGVRVVEPVEVPAAVTGQRADHVAAVGDHLPQVLR